MSTISPDIDTGLPIAAREFAQEFANDAGDDDTGAIVARGLALADIVTQLNGDPEIIAASILYPLLENGRVSRRQLLDRFPAEVVQLARALVRIGSFGFPSNWNPEAGLDAGQSETLRKMLLAIIEDVRLVLVRLADQLHRLQSLKEGPEHDRRLAALETREIYAPLANKLGIWQLKWELEDLAFRFLEPVTYKRIANLLHERRSDREKYIAGVIAELQAELTALGIRADIRGRPKHIFSIWKKMDRKEIGFDSVYDVRAIRVLVDTVGDCYTVLGIAHGKWSYIPREFDDYIATPKENQYQSLHTAVIGPQQKTVEIQIRTHQMHEHAELGVAAHWKYKEGSTGKDTSYDAKIRWVRSLIEPSEEGSADNDLIDRFKSDLFEDRVYVLTPAGDILDLPRGATPLDFAYHVHTDLGHRCRGARINGHIVPLTHSLSNGDQVDIITARSAKPSRDWLIPKAGYLASSRARAKVRHWFRRQDQQHNLEQGQAFLERELGRLGAGNIHVNDLARHFNLPGGTDMYIAVGAGDITAADIAVAVQQRLRPSAPSPEREALPLRKQAHRNRGGVIDVDGVGDLLTNLARCCKPAPPDAIGGYITLGRGVSIHRSDCRNFLRLADEHRERVLEVNWSADERHTFPVDVMIDAHDRRGLVKDISATLSAEKINIVAMSTRTDKETLSAHFDLTVEITGLEELSRLMHRIGNLPNIVSVRRA